MGEATNVAALLAAVLGAGVGTVGGYVFGVSQSRNERRDNALAEIFKEMMLFYRGVVAWTAPNQTTGPITEPGTTWRDHCRRQYEVFISAYQGNAIWLGKDTQEMIQEVAQAGMDFLNGVDTHGRGMSDGTRAWDWRANNLMPKLDKVQDALRSEVEASRYIIPYRIVIKKSEPEQNR